MQFVLLAILVVWTYFAWNWAGKTRAAWLTLAIIIVTAPIGSGVILLGTLPGSPVIFLLILSILNLLAHFGVINPLPNSGTPQENSKGKSFMQILAMIYLRRRSHWY